VERLTGLDAAFLAMETPTVAGHAGSVSLLDPSTARQPLTLDRLTVLVAERLHLVPAFRRRLAEIPLGLGHPYWIEDPDLDLAYHVRELALPAPGGMSRLQEEVSRLHARHLDRSRPLWELYLDHGVGEGRLAVYLKVHHAAIDGVSGNALMAALMDTVPEGRPVDPAAPTTRDRVPGPLELLVRTAPALARTPVAVAGVALRLLRSLPAVVSRPARLGFDRSADFDEDVVLPGATIRRAPPTPFNRPIGAHRRCALRTLSFDDVRSVKAAFGVTVNDTLVALCAGALRRWLDEHGALPDAPLVAAVPVSVRGPADAPGGNRISMLIGPIPTHLDRPADRVRAAHEAMRSAKEVHGALPAGLLADVAQVAMPALVGQAARLSARLRLLERVSPFNLVISNVPGPQVPLYYGGARLLAYHPLAAVVDGQGLNITVNSYGGRLHVGLLADRDLVRDLDHLADLLAVELAALVEAATGDAPLSAPRRPSLPRAGRPHPDGSPRR
jgi:diacylglycerol O-acyltransferase